MEVQGAGEPVAKDLTQFAGGGGRGGQGLSLSHGGSIWDVKDDRPGEERWGQGFPGRWLSQGEHLTHAIWKEPDRVTDGSGERAGVGVQKGRGSGWGPFLCQVKNLEFILRTVGFKRKVF